MINFVLISVDGILRFLKLRECTIGYCEHEFICCLKFIISLLYACGVFMRVICPIALLIKTLRFLFVLNLKMKMIGKTFLVIIAVVDCPYIGLFLNAKSSFILVISLERKFFVFNIFYFIKI